jgi:hypothetical protein
VNLRINLLLGATAVGIAVTVSACGTKASLPWCADLNAQGRVDCDYRSFEQCQATVRGLGGTCGPNPRTRARDLRQKVRA